MSFALNKNTKAIADLITVPGLINLDFADIKAVMSNAGSALMGTGEAEGENRIQKAVEDAVDSPLVEVNIEGARGVLINVTGDPDITMAEIEEAARNITERTAPDANIIFGATIDKELKGKVKISVIATGFDTSRASLYQHIKKPQPTLINLPNQPKIETPEIKKTPEPTELNNNQINEFLKNKEVPTGIDIIDEYDIPAFLRKNK
jgi:cell division protein FtsZ